MTPSPKNTFFFLLLLIHLLSSFTNATTSFDSGSPADFSNLNFIGDARMVNNSLMLTRVTSSWSSVAGGVFYRKPIKLVSEPPLSFSTNFTLLITNSNKERTGGGAAFVIRPDDDDVVRIGGAGESLGVPSGAVSVEFDTRMDERVGDISGNHVGVNLGTMVSSRAVSLDPFRIDLRTDGRPLNAWIDYDGATQRLKIYVSYRDGKPNRPVLSTRVGLSRYVKKHVYVGLTASTQSSTEAHSVRNWSFGSFMETGSSPAVPPPPTSNVPIPVKEQRGLLDRLIPWGIVVLALVASAAGSFYCIRIRNAVCCNDCCNNICL